MQLEADMYATDKSWKIIFVHFSNLEILNNKTVEFIANFTVNTGNNCNIHIRKRDYVSSSLYTYCFRWFVVGREPVSSALYAACGSTVNPKSTSSLK
jgi:hypothetical protein